MIDPSAPDHALWREGDAALASEGDLASARLLLHEHVPRDRAQAAFRAGMLAFVDRHPDALLRSCVEGHLTASALVLDAARERALLTLHARLGRWLQVGGHCDGDGNLPAVALREAREETGIEGLAIDPRPIDLDVHRIPARPDEPEHAHLDVRFLIVAPPGAVPRRNHESRELRWLAPRELADVATDDSVRRLFALAFGDA